MPFQNRCIRKLAGLPDHLVRLEENARGDGDPERLGGLEVDDQLVAAKERRRAPRG
jgi:hypothetical protein